MGNATSLKHHLETAEKTGVIQLSKSNLRELPKDLLSIGHLLRTLDLNTNRIQILTDNVSLFKNLKILNMSNNRLTSVSPAIGQLSKLESLLLESNQLASLPNELSQLNNLKTLNLSKNKFSVFPAQTSHLKSLELLDLSDNAIDILPDTIGQCSANEINLNNNRLQKLNDSLKDCPKLKILRLDNNQLAIAAMTRPILADSKICLLSLENNLFTLKQLQERDGYDEYGERYTSTKRKMI